MAGILGESRERRGVSRHPPRTARRVARQRRHARRGGRQLHRCPRHQVLGAPRFVDQETRQVARRRRAGRNDAAFRSHRGECRSEVAGGARCARAQARPAGPALGKEPRPGRGARARHALRATCLRKPPGGLCVLRRRALAWHLHPLGAGRGRFRDAGALFAHNRRLVAEIERLEHKSRRPDILVDEELIHAFYDARVPQGISSGADFDKWRKDAERKLPRLLYLSRDDLMRHRAAGITTDNFPPALQLGPNRLALEYLFEPGSPRDGVTMNVPLALLNQVPAARTEWLVPGLLKEKIRAMAKSIPQRLRHKLGSLDAFAAAFCEAVPPSDTPLAAALARHIREKFNLD